MQSWRAGDMFAGKKDEKCWNLGLWCRYPFPALLEAFTVCRRHRNMGGTTLEDRALGIYLRKGMPRGLSLPILYSIAPLWLCAL